MIESKGSPSLHSIFMGSRPRSHYALRFTLVAVSLFCFPFNTEVDRFLINLVTLLLHDSAQVCHKWCRRPALHDEADFTPPHTTIVALLRFGREVGTSWPDDNDLLFSYRRPHHTGVTITSHLAPSTTGRHSAPVSPTISRSLWQTNGRSTINGYDMAALYHYLSVLLAYHWLQRMAASFWLHSNSFQKDTFFSSNPLPSILPPLLNFSRMAILKLCEKNQEPCNFASCARNSGRMLFVFPLLLVVLQLMLIRFHWRQYVVVCIAGKDNKESSVPNELGTMRGHGLPIQRRMIEAANNGAWGWHCCVSVVHFFIAIVIKLCWPVPCRMTRRCVDSCEDCNEKGEE